MARIVFLLTRSPRIGQHADTVYRIANAALKKSHNVDVVFLGDAIYALIRSQASFTGSLSIGDKFRELQLKGARLFAGDYSVEGAGLSGKTDLMLEVSLVDWADISDSLARAEVVLSF